MLRLVELALFLAPFVVFAVWRFMAIEGGPPVRVVVGAACVLAVLAGALIWLSQEDALPPGASLRTGAAAGRQGRLGPRRAAMSERTRTADRTAGLPGGAGAGRGHGGAPRGARGRRRGARRAGGPRCRRNRSRDAAHTRAGDRRRFEAAGIRAVPTGLDHGTVTAVANGRGFEVTTLRRDVETDGRHAVVAFTDDWRADAARRDFTINAMSLTRSGEVFDYFGGIGDLRAGIVRFVGDPATRIAEDYLRILRYFRFFARLCRRASRSRRAGSDPRRCGRTRQAVGRARMERVGPYLSAPDPRAAIGLMAELGVLPRCCRRVPIRRGLRGWSRRMPRRIRCCAWRRCCHGRSRGAGCTPAAVGGGARSAGGAACRPGAAARRR